MTSPEPPPYPDPNRPPSGLPNYGSFGPPPPPPGGGSYGQGFQGQRANQLALWSMITGIVAFPLLCMCGIGLLPAIVALVLGFIARGQIQKSQGTETGMGQALAGIILGAIGVVLAIAYVISMLAIGLSSPNYP